MSDRQFERALTDWLEDGSDRTPKRAIDGVLFAVKTTPQERDLRIPWRFPQMTGLTRAIAVAALTLVVVVGGGALFLNNRNDSGVAAPTASPSAATSPSPSPSIDVPAGFAPFTSLVYGYTLVYPDGWDVGAATDKSESDEFVSADNDFGVGVSKVPAGAGADLATLPGLTAWAKSYCNAHTLGACDTYEDRAVQKCLNAGGEPCRAAILVHSEGKVPAEEGEYAFFGDWANVPSGGVPESVVVLGTGRGDTYPGAAQFGGARRLLKTMLESLGVTGASGGSEVAPGISEWTPFTSPLYGYALGYPKGWDVGPATKVWQPGDGMTIDSTSDIFVNPANDVGLSVLRAAAAATDVESVDALKAWATVYCNGLQLTGCDTLGDRTEVMCLATVADPCRPAILVRSTGSNPEDDSEWAFFGDWKGAPSGSSPDGIIAVGTGRGDAYPGATQYGGAVQLLKSVISTMGVTPAP